MRFNQRHEGLRKVMEWDEVQERHEGSRKVMERDCVQERSWREGLCSRKVMTRG